MGDDGSDAKSWDNVRLCKSKAILKFRCINWFFLKNNLKWGRL